MPQFLSYRKMEKENYCKLTFCSTPPNDAYSVIDKEGQARIVIIAMAYCINTLHAIYKIYNKN